ncbi:MAG: flagellar hook-length control protein FliK [Rhodobacteraceae bacterium]|nr:flagellar hook-length control protein FliK [Paracoccaceae bacterium]
MSNSIINTANSKTVGSLSADANGALPESGDVFANLFQVLNGSAQVQSGEGSDLLNIQNVGINVIRAASDLPQSHLSGQVNEISETHNISGSQTLDSINLKAFKIPMQNTGVDNANDTNQVSRAIVEIEEISTMLAKLISEETSIKETLTEETLPEILLSPQVKAQRTNLPFEDDTGLEGEKFYNDFSFKGLPQDLSLKSLNSLKSFEVASPDLEISNSIKDQKTVKIILGDVDSDEAVFVTVAADQDKNILVKSQELSGQFSEPLYTQATISETDNELVLNIQRKIGPPGVVVVEINELLESADFDQKFKVEVVLEDDDPKAITTEMRESYKPSTIIFDYAQTDASKYEISEISSEISFDKNDILMVKEKLRNLLDAYSKAQSTQESGKIIKEAISNSIEAAEKQELVSVAIRKVIGDHQREHREKPMKASLMVSSADVISLRADAIKPVYINQEGFKYFNVSRENITSWSSLEENDKILKRANPPAENTEHDTSRFIDKQLKLGNNSSQTEVITQSANTSLLNSYLSRNLSILDAQFASRLAAIAVEQAMTTSEAIELNLEPKSFGKLQINASLDNSGLEIKLTAENSATISILRSTEGLLSSITEQHGLRLSQYSVDFAHGESGGQSRKDHSENMQAGVEKRSLENEELMKTGDATIDSNRLLNLIA